MQIVLIEHWVGKNTFKKTLLVCIPMYQLKYCKVFILANLKVGSLLLMLLIAQSMIILRNESMKIKRQFWQDI